MVQVASGSSFATKDEVLVADDQVESCQGAPMGSLLTKRKAYAVQGDISFCQRRVVRRCHRRSMSSGVDFADSEAGESEPSTQVLVPLLEVSCPPRGNWRSHMLNSKEEGSKDVGSASSSPGRERFKTLSVTKYTVGAKGGKDGETKLSRVLGNGKKQGGGGGHKVTVAATEEESEEDTDEEDEDPPLSKFSEESSALVRSKRGRAQALPSRFRDSVVEPLKKGTKGTKLLPRDSEALDSMPAPANSKKRTKISGQESVASYIGMPRSAAAQPQKKARKNMDKEGQSEVLKVEVVEEDDDRKESSSRLSTGAAELDNASDAEVKGNLVTNFPDVHKLGDFDLGEIVWAKSGKRNDPVWPAKVIDPIREAPGLVRKLSLPNRLCVMFYGPSLSKGKQRVGFSSRAFISSVMVDNRFR